MLFNRIVTCVLVLCAVTLTGLVAARELREGEDPLRAGGSSLAAQRVLNWEQYGEHGAVMGPRNAAVTIVEFADFRCGYCRDLAAGLKEVREEFGERLRLVYRHFLIRGGEPTAAVAAECADRAGVFEAYHDALFEREAGFGAEWYVGLFEEVGGRGREGFVECLGGSWARGRVAEDQAAAWELGVRGTPTLLINDRIVVGAAPIDVIRAMVQEALEGSSG